MAFPPRELPLSDPVQAAPGEKIVKLRFEITCPGMGVHIEPRGDSWAVTPISVGTTEQAAALAGRTPEAFRRWARRNGLRNQGNGLWNFATVQTAIETEMRRRARMPKRERPRAGFKSGRPAA